MFIEWTKHLSDPEAKSRFENQVHSAKDVLDRIKHLLSEKEQTLDRQENNIEVYNMPNWSHRQAHKNGQRSSLAWLKQLVDLDTQKKDVKYDQ